MDGKVFLLFTFCCMKKNILFLVPAIIILFVLGLYYISFRSGADQVKNIPIGDRKLKVVTSFYPLYEVAHQIGGDRIELKNLVPAGAEPHDYEPSPGDIAGLYDADLVIYNGAGLEPWADKLAPELAQKNVQTLNQSQYKSPAAPMTDEEGNVVADPHFWLDPQNYMNDVRFISEKLIQLDPKNQSFYEQNTQKFMEQLQALDQQFQNGLKNCKSRTIVTSHDAFSYFSRRYNLEVISIAGLSPDAEPSAQWLADLTKILQEKQIHYIFLEALVSPKVAQSLAREVGVQTLPLNPLEGLTSDEITAGKNYVSIMQENLANLKIALECR